MKDSFAHRLDLKREIVVTGSLDHTNLIKLYEVIGDFDDFEDAKLKDKIYLVFEYADLG